MYAKLKDPVGKCKVMESVSAGAVTAGTMLVKGGLLCYVLKGAAAAGETMKLVWETQSGGLELPKQSGLVITEGDEVFWDTGASEIDKTNTNVNAGYCVRPAAAGDSTVRISLMNTNIS